MTGHRSAGIGLLLGAIVGACTGPNLPTLPLLPPASEVGGAVAQSGPSESSLAVAGSPTGVFAQVARGALGCWFAAGGPLKASHVYRAEAEPPAKGGAAEIVIFERDASTRDQRGSRAYRVSFASEASGVRVTATALKFEAAIAQAMARDVAAWAKGGESCQLRAALPPPPAPAAAKPSKAAGPGKKGAPPGNKGAPTGKKR